MLLRKIFLYYPTYLQIIQAFLNAGIIAQSLHKFTCIQGTLAKVAGLSKHALHFPIFSFYNLFFFCN